MSSDQSDRVGLQVRAVEQVLHDVVVRVADVRLGIDQQPGRRSADSTLPACRSVHKHPRRARVRQIAQQRQPVASEAGVEPGRVGGEASLRACDPTVGHHRERAERVAHR